MKKTIKEILEETFNDQGKWNYFSGDEFSIFPLDSEKESQEFIKSFIKLSGKAKNKLYSQIDKIRSRSVHVVSAFFLGHYLYQNTALKTKIDKEIERLLKNLDIKSDVNFSYMWFLICLFHDLGYEIEKKQPIEYKSFDELSSTRQMPPVSGIPKFYNLIYKNYFKYRLKEHCKNDHGITAAHIMYSKLCEIRKLADSSEVTGNNLNWEKDLEYIYGFCAWNVLAHNIWFGDKDEHCDVKNYKKYKIKRLLFDDKYKIKPNKHPFFFLFCLVDTIEPYKRILNIETLKQIDLEVMDDKLIITSNLKCGCDNIILEQAENLNKWLTPTNRKENTVEIFLK